LLCLQVFAVSIIFPSLPHSRVILTIKQLAVLLEIPLIFPLFHSGFHETRLSVPVPEGCRFATEFVLSPSTSVGPFILLPYSLPFLGFRHHPLVFPSTRHLISFPVGISFTARVPNFEEVPPPFSLPRAQSGIARIYFREEEYALPLNVFGLIGFGHSAVRRVSRRHYWRVVCFSIRSISKGHQESSMISLRALIENGPRQLPCAASFPPRNAPRQFFKLVYSFDTIDIWQDPGL